jgi:chromosome segregation ATPase
MRRPMPRTLAAFALVGWILAIWAFWSSASDRYAAGAQLSAADAARQKLADENTERTKTVGSLDEVRQQLTAAHAAVLAASKDRDTISTQLDSSRKDIETAKAALADLLEQRRQATDSLGSTKTDLAKLEEAVAARTAELTEATKGLDTERQQESDIGITVTRLKQEAEIAQATATQAQQAEAAAQKQLADTREALAALIKDKGAAVPDLTGLQQQVRDPKDGGEAVPNRPTDGDQPGTRQ